MDRIAACVATKGCDKTQWFNGLATVSLPYEKKLLYGVPLYERRNEYPNNIINIRSPKYVPPWDAIVLNDEGAVVGINEAQPPLQSVPQQPEAPIPEQPTQLAENTTAEPSPYPITPASTKAVEAIKHINDGVTDFFTSISNTISSLFQYLKNLI